MADDLHDNTALQRFELDVAGHTAFVEYEFGPGTITFVHTEVPAALSGQGIGSRLARAALSAARARGLKVVVKCDFMAAYVKKHPEFNDLLA